MSKNKEAIISQIYFILRTYLQSLPVDFDGEELFNSADRQTPIRKIGPLSPGVNAETENFQIVGVCEWVKADDRETDSREIKKNSERDKDKKMKKGENISDMKNIEQNRELGDDNEYGICVDLSDDTVSPTIIGKSAGGTLSQFLSPSSPPSFSPPSPSLFPSPSSSPSKTIQTNKSQIAGRVSTDSTLFAQTIVRASTHWDDIDLNSSPEKGKNNSILLGNSDLDSRLNSRGGAVSPFFLENENENDSTKLCFVDTEMEIDDTEISKNENNSGTKIMKNSSKEKKESIDKKENLSPSPVACGTGEGKLENEVVNEVEAEGETDELNIFDALVVPLKLLTNEEERVKLILKKDPRSSGNSVNSYHSEKRKIKKTASGNSLENACMDSTYVQQSSEYVQNLPYGVSLAYVLRDQMMKQVNSMINFLNYLICHFFHFFFHIL
jgi:hypothetical protein